jgi:hypothetical protein
LGKAFARISDPDPAPVDVLFSGKALVAEEPASLAALMAASLMACLSAGSHALNLLLYGVLRLLLTTQPSFAGTGMPRCCEIWTREGGGFVDLGCRHSGSGIFVVIDISYGMVRIPRCGTSLYRQKLNSPTTGGAKRKQTTNVCRNIKDKARAKSTRYGVPVLYS